LNIWLQIMTRELCRSYMKDFVPDPALFQNPSEYKPYIYDEAQCDAYFDRHAALKRVHLAVMLDEEAIGEIILKKINRVEKHCTLGISMKNSCWINKGYGSVAEKLALEYAFHQLELETVYADTLLNNIRSQRVLMKNGFREITQDNTFRYYRCDKPANP